MSRLADLVRFYDLLDRLEQKLGEKHQLSALSTIRNLPTAGVYFFFEPGEERRETGNGSRVVRVGTHGLTEGSKSTLKQRLSQHRGSSSGRGNHRGSIFRLLIGDALLARGKVPPCHSWGLQSDIGKAAVVLNADRSELERDEAPIEEAVSKYIGQMPVLWIAATDAAGPGSLRGLIERNSIGLLSNFQRHALDAASPDWTGLASSRPSVRASGLWNQRHVDEEPNAEFLIELENSIDAM